MDEEEIWEPKPMGKDFATTEEVSKVAGVERASLYEWVREGLLPAPQTTGGRGIIAKWPLATLKIAKFVRRQRALGFGLVEIRPRLIAAFGEKITTILSEPRGPRARARQAMAKKKTVQKKTAKKKTAKKKTAERRTRR
jgi:DNA-binding transcriptional MerR regulator